MNTPRLLIILNRFVIGGQAADTVSLAYHLKEGLDILILYGKSEADELEAGFLLQQYPGLKIRQISSLRRGINPLRDLAAFAAIIKIIKSFKPSIVHTHGAKSGLHGRLAAYFCGVKAIVHTFHGHVFHSYFNPVVSRLIICCERLLASITHATIVLSNSQYREVVQKFKISEPQKTTTIPLGLSFGNYHLSEQERLRFRQKFNIQPNDVAIGIVGRIVPIKNHRFFLTVVQSVLSSDVELKPVFLIIGDGFLRQQLQEFLRDNNISFGTTATDKCRVIFASWLTDVNEFMNGLDIVALTSLNEGTPLSLIEAQYFKNPVIATNVGGVKDTILDQQTGLLVENANLQMFTEKLVWLVNSPQRRFEMGEEGHRFITERYDKSVEVQQMTALYQRLLTRHKNLRQVY